MNRAIYDPKTIEPKWRQAWGESNLYLTPDRDEAVEKAYVLGMFPYPSGDGLHTGHGRIFTAVDVIGRYLRMRGKQVLMPMGWDAFGLPAENAAIKVHKNPMEMVPVNEANFKRQMEMLGLSYDWERAFSTTDPNYYKWTQWLFLKLYSLKNEKGERLIYRKEVPINWCPKCKTGLANEEVLADGTHERCGTMVEQRMLPQWVMRITDYAQRLLDDLQGLDWPEGILAMQRNWLGKKEGYRVNFGKVEVFTTRLDTICGVSFVVVSPELAQKWLDQGWKPKSEVVEYIEASLKKMEQQRLEEGKEKTGVNTGEEVINPVTGEKVPLFVGDYVLGNVGTGAVMGVPAHDARDFEFAKKYNLPIKWVVSKPSEFATEEDGVLVNSGRFDGMQSAEAREEIAKSLGDKAVKEVGWHLRDWVFSRQRYWGEPFPLVYCDKCGDDPTSPEATRGRETDFDITVIDGKKYAIVPLSEDQLPLMLPQLDSYEPTDDGKSPLSRVDEWLQTTCPNCGGVAHRETDTMPNWAGSCWYYLYFAGRPHPNPLLGKERAMGEVWRSEMAPDIKKWGPVDWYLGGAEHAVLHLLYARFWNKAFFDLGLVNFVEPFSRLRSVGMVLASDGRKMSKSLGNVVNPDDVVAQYGADAVRTYEMFMGPWDQAIAWDPRSLVGCYRLIEKLYKLIYRNLEFKGETGYKIKQAIYETVIKIGSDIELLKFNTAVAALMKLVNLIGDEETVSLSDLQVMVRSLAPLVPFVADEMWEMLGGKSSVHRESWPTNLQIDTEKSIKVIVVQVNGKLKATIEMSMVSSQDQELVTKLASENEKVSKFLTGVKYETVFVPGRLVNFVIRG